ncbi:MAG: FAD:protein FMN transferase [Ilumatobacteraceae bacterium]
MAVVEHRGRVMASDLHLITVGDREHCEAAIAFAVEQLDHYERCWSRFLPTSDISRINRSPGGGLAVDDATLTLLTVMMNGHRATDGRFDPTVLPALAASGYAASKADPSLVSEFATVDGDAPSVLDVVLDVQAGMVHVPPGLTLDAGGIGKGLAADLIVAQLLHADLDGALVSIGGDMAMAGTPPDAAGWLVTVEQPDPRDGDLCHLAISAGGVATSSTRSRRWLQDGNERHHHIDPATAMPSTTDLATATVIAGNGWLAEIHATAALSCGTAGILDYLADHGLSGLAVDLHGRVLRTPDLLDVALLTPAGAR